MIYNLATSKFTGKALVVKLKKLGFECAQHGISEPVFEEFQHGFSVTIYKKEDVGVNVGVNGLLSYVQFHPGQRAGEMAAVFKLTRRTIERWLKQLKENGKVEYRGATKTGGYSWTQTNEASRHPRYGYPVNARRSRAKGAQNGGVFANQGAGIRAVADGDRRIEARSGARNITGEC